MFLNFGGVVLEGFHAGLHGHSVRPRSLIVSGASSSNYTDFFRLLPGRPKALQNLAKKSNPLILAGGPPAMRSVSFRSRPRAVVLRLVPGRLSGRRYLQNAGFPAIFGRRE